MIIEWILFNSLFERGKKRIGSKTIPMPPEHLRPKKTEDEKFI